MAVESPCIRICQLDPQDKHCLGCLRTLDEIRRWSSMPDAERRRIKAELPARRAQTPAILPLHSLSEWQ